MTSEADRTRAAPLIDIRGATVYRQNKRVFDDLSLTIDQGERTVLLGPNGSGKTTLLQLLTRKLYPVVRPGSRVRILGSERLSIWDLYRVIGFVSHELQHEFLRDLCAREAVLSGFTASVGLRGLRFRATGDQARAADALMARFGVADLAERRFDRLSTGQQRRVLLARSLVHDPDALILDEPAAGLDLGATFAFIGLLREQLRAGRTVVYATHHVGEIPPEIERVVIMRDCRVLCDGPKREVLTQARLSELYDTPVRLLERDGFYATLPAV